jgi:hypothetical protein
VGNPATLRTLRYAIQLMFKLTKNKRDKELLELVAKFMNCGAVYSHGENAFYFTVSNFADNKNIIIPMFKNLSNSRNKKLEYPDFCKVAALIDKGKHLTDEGLAEILLIKDRLNTKRK